MAEKTYNTGRVVGWSAYEEFLKETGADPNIITNYVYQTLVTYGVTRIVELTPGNWVASHGGQFYTQTIRVQGASWGAVPIVGLDYESYLDVFNNPSSSTAGAESIDAEEKDAIETAVGNIFGVYVSDARGNKVTSSVSAHGYLTFVAYPDILEFNEKIGTISGGVLKLIVRGLSMEDLDVNTLYYGPQGFIFAGNGLVEDCYHDTRDINNLSLNSAGYLWLSMGGNATPADYRGLVDHPSGEILISTFGYMDLDFIEGTGRFSNLGRYGLTYAEYQDALHGLNVLDTQVTAIPQAERDDYYYLISGIAEYTSYPPAAYPVYAIPVRKDTGRINVGSFDSLRKPKTKKYIDFTRLYTANGEDSTVMYLYDKKLPDYLGNWWGTNTVPFSAGLTYLGNNSMNRWLSSDDVGDGATFHESGRQATWKIYNKNLPFAKGSVYLFHDQSDGKANGVYLCTKDKNHSEQDYWQLNRFGSYIPWTIPQWYKDKTGNFFAEIDLTGFSTNIQSGVLYVNGTPVFPGEPMVIGVQACNRLVYVWNTIASNQPKLIVYTNSIANLDFDATASASFATHADEHSNRIRIPRAAWDAAFTGRSIEVWTGTSSKYNFTTTIDGATTLGTFVEVRHQKEGVWGYNRYFRYVVLSCKSDYVHLASTMVWVDNPNLTSTVGYPGTYNSVVPRYNQQLPDASGNYHYNMKSVLSRTPASRLFSDFGWDIADYVDEDFQNISLGEFLQECVIRTDLTVPKSPDTLRSFALDSTFRLYSIADLRYTSGVIPQPTEANPIRSSMYLTAKTTPKSFFDTAWYTAQLTDGTPLEINNLDYPIWTTIAKSRHGNQTVSISTIDDHGVQLDFSGNEGEIPVDKITWLDLLIGLGTGKSIDLLHGMKVRKMDSDCNYLITADGTRLYISTTEPVPGPGEEIPDGSIGIGW
jgi:hypothetical protein